MRSMPKVCSAARNGGSAEDAAGGDPDLVEDGAADRPLQVVDVEREHLVDASQHHRQHFAHVADDELEPADAGRASRPAPCAARGSPSPNASPSRRLPARGPRPARQIGVIGLPHRLGRQVRMDVDRHVELDRRREQAVVARVIEEAALGRAVDQRAEEAQVLDARARARRRRRPGSASAARRSRRSGRDGGRRPPPDGRSSRAPWRRRRRRARDRGRDRCSRAPAR